MLSYILIYILFCMIFCHIVDDFYLQGWLATGKQRSWWIKNAPEEMYNKDYIAALLMHAFSWSFMIMIPMMLYTDFMIGWFILIIPINMMIHAIVDNAKANKHSINLLQDQGIHIMQIFITYVLFIKMVI